MDYKKFAIIRSHKNQNNNQIYIYLAFKRCTYLCYLQCSNFNAKGNVKIGRVIWETMRSQKSKLSYLKLLKLFLKWIEYWVIEEKSALAYFREQSYIYNTFLEKVDLCFFLNERFNLHIIVFCNKLIWQHNSNVSWRCNRFCNAYKTFLFDIIFVK